MGTDRIQFGHSGEQLRDFAIWKRSRAVTRRTALYYPSKRHFAWSLHSRRKSIRDADEGHVRPTVSFALNPPRTHDLGRTRFTRDQVPVSLKLYLKWQLEEPLKLTAHGYETPYDALRDKTQSILTQIVAHRTKCFPQA